MRSVAENTKWGPELGREAAQARDFRPFSSEHAVGEQCVVNARLGQELG